MELKAQGCLFEGSFMRGDPPRIAGIFYSNDDGFGFRTEQHAERDVFFKWSDVTDLQVMRLGNLFGLVVNGRSSVGLAAMHTPIEIGILDLDTGRTFKGAWNFFQNQGRLPAGDEIYHAKRGSFDGKAQTDWEPLLGQVGYLVVGVLIVLALAVVIVKSI
jgi:hypothetical protein